MVSKVTAAREQVWCRNGGEQRRGCASGGRGGLARGGCLLGRGPRMKRVEQRVGIWGPPLRDIAGTLGDWSWGDS